MLLTVISAVPFNVTCEPPLATIPLIPFPETFTFPLIVNELIVLLLLTANTPIDLFPDTSIDGVPVAPTVPVDPFKYTPILFVSPVPVIFIPPVFSILALFTAAIPIPFDIVLFVVVVIVPIFLSLAPFANIPIANLLSNEIVPLFITVA